ncbi:MAG: hypothetical protein COU35_00185 [Candidatus Magasanikbacteria bacterium CG10_big_fil_rev_8_21_14_0_10_47_10]|uniref:Uncharacterized protein n=1 Tax=Candidatus Magasanikbacteria bacterium CG10_big_fil_rev_8_21_14_0_10_47_10 TaxID=1974652 RepID=A0A2H0TTL4_9BACT|nr:MAG: hypothetical protein COU35_00185 [Candidatus Magasanikbacteria bacterium CG10_big_fil_rev_8_21_14_0_10_47_10]
MSCFIRKHVAVKVGWGPVREARSRTGQAGVSIIWLAQGACHVRNCQKPQGAPDRMRVEGCIHARGPQAGKVGLAGDMLCHQALVVGVATDEA